MKAASFLTTTIPTTLSLNGVKLARSSYFPTFQFQEQERLTHSRGWVLVQMTVSQKHAVDVASCSSSTMRVLPQVPNTARAEVAAKEVEDILN